LQSQRTAGVVVLQLLKMCQELLERVRDVPALQPGQITLNSWLRGNLNTAVFRSGIQAVEWTINDRGLAGVGDLQGLPWLLPMDRFFEAWVETVVGQMAKRTGGIVKSGRLWQTITPLGWSPPYLGSQRYLLPDIVLDREQETVIFDAKYKNHWEELNRDGWNNLDKKLQEYHRSDLLQYWPIQPYPKAKGWSAALPTLAVPIRGIR
jgi:hypothetical protein